MGYRLIDHRLFLPPASEVPAWYDLASGLIGIAHTYNDLRQHDHRTVRDAPSLDNPVVALTHENIHFIQAVATPFLLEWSHTWAAITSQPLRQIDPSLIVDEGLRSAMATWDDGAHAVRAQSHLDLLFTPGALGVDVFTLIESHATFLEVCAYTDATEPAQVVAYFDQFAPAPAYRRAYDIVRFWCGDAVAHRAFHAIFLSALSDPNPPRAFDRLVFACAQKHGPDVEEFLRACAATWHRQLSAAIGRGALGPHAQTFVPLFTRWVEDIGVVNVAGDPRTFAHFPHCPAVVFGADETHTFGVFPGSLSTGDPDPEDPETVAEFSWAYSIAAISQHLIGQRAGVEVHSVLADEFAWLGSVKTDYISHTIRVDSWGAVAGAPKQQVEEAIRIDVYRTAALFSGIEQSHSASAESNASGPRIPMSWVRRVVMDFETTDGREVWRIPEIARFVELLNRELPWFPVLLRYPGHADLPLIWFANLVPDAVVTRGGRSGLNRQHHGLLAALEAYVDAVLAAAPPGVDPSPAVSTSLAAIMLPHLSDNT